MSILLSVSYYCIVRIRQPFSLDGSPVTVPGNFACRAMTLFLFVDISGINDADRANAFLGCENIFEEASSHDVIIISKFGHFKICEKNHVAVDIRTCALDGKTCRLFFFSPKYFLIPLHDNATNSLLLHKTSDYRN